LFEPEYPSSGVVVTGNEIDHNNTDGFDQTWEAGGAKWSKTTTITVSGNNVHDNAGDGLWFDTDNVSVTILGNRIA